MQRISWIISAVMLSQLFCGTAWAFKVDLHIWIAQQVLDDAADGRINLDFGDDAQRLQVPTRYAQALRNHPQAFLLGSIGPDAFPDVLSGQMVIHPSVPGGWGTAEWLQHMLSTPDMTEQEMAFALGNLTHAAADVFAHTYVNRYAGDVFELADHEWAAIRHINIESFMSNYIPPMIISGRPVDMSAIVQDGGLGVPKDFLARRFFFNESAMQQFDRSGVAPHLVAVAELHRSLTDLLEEGGDLEQIEALGLQLVTEAQLGIPVGLAQIAEVQRIANRVNAELNNFAGDLAGYAKDLNSELGQIEGLQYDVIQGGMGLAIDVTAELTKAQLDLADQGAKLLRLQNEIVGLPTTITGKVCDRIKGALGFLGKLVCTVVEYSNPSYVLTKRALEETTKLIANLKNEVSRLQVRSKAVIREAVDVIKATIELRVAVTNQFIDFALNKPIGSQFRNHMERWRDNLPIVMGAYAEANAQAIINSIDPSEPSILEPLTDWLICYAPALTSIPVEVSETVCVVGDGIDQLKKEIEELENALVELLPILQPIVELKRELEAKVEEIKEELYSIAVTEGIKGFDGVAGTNMLPFYKALTQTVGVAELNAVMSVDDSGQGLLLIPDAAERIIAEMHLVDDRFDPDRFAPVRDAVVLAKLAMLDQAGLIQLAKAADVNQSVFGPYLYQDGGAVAENILFGFVQSIDGNHQWHDLAPPHPRVDGFDEVDFAERTANADAGYGYPDKSCPRVLGMRMWADAEARDSLFQELFLGRLAFAIDEPESFEPPFSPVLAADYPRLVDGDWLRDGVTLLSSDEVAYQVRATLHPRLASADVLVDGHLVGSAAAVQGQVQLPITVPRYRIPFKLTMIGRSAAGTEVSSVQSLVGCAESDQGASGFATVEVKPGNSLWRISEHWTGDGRNFPELHAANDDVIDDPDLIYPGQVLKLPWPISLSAVAR